MTLYLFPAAFMANTFAMMLVMIGLSLLGRSELAADFGIVHGATVALFYALSGNARSLIIGGSRIGAVDILRLRCLMLAPLSALAFSLSVGVVDVQWPIALLLVSRRACEWLAEVFLSEHEANRSGKLVVQFLLTQGALSLGLLLVLVFDAPFSLAVFATWAFSPLLWSVRGRLLRSAWNSHSNMHTLRSMLPHLGSTAVIGVCVYVFRLFILLLTGKPVAGDLFAAFALGGILGAVFSQVLGPTLVKAERDAGGAPLLPQMLMIVCALSLFGGSALSGFVLVFPGALDWTGKGNLFWFAVGCSLIGGVVMVLAQRIRLRILQNGAGQDVFGSDMLANVLLISCVPFFYYVLGVESLATLYLLGALLSLIFYASEAKGLFMDREFMSRINRWVLPVLAFLVFVPVFFQLSNGLFRDISSRFSSEGNLSLLPLPLSIAACYAGIVLLGGYARARGALVVVFLTFMGMLLSTVLLASEHGAYERAKLILLVQYVLPMFALVLGQQFGCRREALSYLGLVLFWILLTIIPLQLAFTLGSGLSYLSPSVFLFSIYQHLQYVPVLFVGGFLIALFALWERPRMQPWLLLLSLLMGLYAALSLSMLAMALLLVGAACFSVRYLRVSSGRSAWVFVLVLISLVLGFYYIANGQVLGQKLGVDIEGGAPRNLQDRIVYWRYYLAGIGESGYSLLLGHLSAPDRSSYPSAHNYYLDFTYNFGLLALLPILGLLAWTLHRLLRHFGVFWNHPATLGVAGVVVFLLLADNSLKVGMRQPYPGIITFFLWGVLVAWLFRLDASGTDEAEIVPTKNG